MLARFEQLFAEQWNLLQQGVPIDWQGRQNSERATAWRALKYYFRRTPLGLEESPEALDISAAADLSEHGLPTLIGVIDQIRTGGTVVDTKVVGKTPDARSLSHLQEVQLTSYSLLYREATGRKELGLELHRLVKTNTPKLIVSSSPPASEQQRLRLFRQIEVYQEGLGRRDFVPSPGLHCAGCEYLERCRRWS